MPDRTPYFCCKNCGWIHFGMSRENCELEVQNFNDYFNTLSDEDKLKYYGGFVRNEKGDLVPNSDISAIKKSSIETYQKCFNCGGSYKDFRAATLVELNKIDGSTIQPIMIFEEIKSEKS